MTSHEQKGTCYRAIYKPDAETEDGIMLFKSKKVYGRIWLMWHKDSDFRYQLSVIKQDKDWFIWRVR